MAIEETKNSTILDYEKIIQKKGLQSLGLYEISEYKQALEKELQKLKDEAKYYETFFKKGRSFTAFTAGLLYTSILFNGDFSALLLLETAALVGGVYFSTVSYDSFKEKDNSAQKMEETLGFIEEETTCRAKLA